MRLRNAVLLVSGLLISTQGWAQSTTSGAIAGSVKDTTGSVLPGVTVEASSPALIEKTRSAVTDSQGNYRILELRPGMYTVTFTLPGFTTVRREGLELTTGFTANVSVELRVGTVEETVTVTGASPVVDVQRVRTQQVLTRELWEALPTGKTYQSYLSLTVGATQRTGSGVSQDVGGTKGEQASGGSFSFRGARAIDSAYFVEGMAINSTGAEPGQRTTHQNQLAFEETTIGSDVSAEQENAGLVINLIPRDGSNALTGNFALNGSGGGLQSRNLTLELIARGLPNQAKVTKMYDSGGGVGGPIMKDRLWFYASDRWWNAKNTIPSGFYNATPEPAYGPIPIFTPDVSRRPPESSTPHHNTDLRLTWQVTKAQKISFFGELQSACACYRATANSNGIGPFRAVEAGTNLIAPYGTKNLFQATWSYVKGSRWLFSVGNSSFLSSGATYERVKEMSPTAIPMEDLDTGFFWNAFSHDTNSTNPVPDGRIVPKNYSHDQRYSVTYSTGSHTLKVGARTQEIVSLPGTGSFNITPLGPVRLQVRGGTRGVAPVPAAVEYFLNPRGPASETENRGGSRSLVAALYVQEQLTVGRMTLNLGMRYDGLHGRYLPYTTAPTDFLPSQTLDGVEDSPAWNDIAPRVGVAYDLFGNGKTAIKGSWGRYVVHDTSAGASPSSRLGYSGGVRTWNDLNTNFVPDCDFGNPQANGECGPVPNANIGLASAQTTFFDPAYITGWGSRPFLWSSGLSVQHQLRPGLGVSVGYFRTSYGNFTVTDNRAVQPSDYSEYCVAAPVDERLGSVSGSRLCGLYDLSPSKFGQVNNLVTHASAFGNPSDTYNGIETNVTARFGSGAMVQGGASTAKTVADNCFVVDVPIRPDYCHTVSSWSKEAQIELFGSYPLPWWGLQVSGTFQNLSGPSVGANRRYTSAQIAPSLGRPLSAGANGTVNIALLPPNTLYEPRFSQTDLRLTKVIRMQKLRMQAQFDAYNVFNSSALLAVNATYGSTWLQPTSILGARLLKFGIQLDWR